MVCLKKTKMITYSAIRFSNGLYYACERNACERNQKTGRIRITFRSSEIETHYQEKEIESPSRHGHYVPYGTGECHTCPPETKHRRERSLMTKKKIKNQTTVVNGIFHIR